MSIDCNGPRIIVHTTGYDAQGPRNFSLRNWSPSIYYLFDPVAEVEESRRGRAFGCTSSINEELKQTLDSWPEVSHEVSVMWAVCSGKEGRDLPSADESKNQTCGDIWWISIHPFVMLAHAAARIAGDLATCFGRRSRPKPPTGKTSQTATVRLIWRNMPFVSVI